MADYVVTLTGKDNLSKTIKSVKQELNSVGGAATKMDKIADKFNRIQNSAAPLKKQLRDTTVLLSQMKFDGNFNAGQFLEMARAAGQAKDSISDTQQVIRAFADDNFVLNSVVQGVQGIAAAGSVATGTMALFGAESETATEAIRKVQGALAILNGLQTIANVLNIDSYVSIARKIIALKAEAVATNSATAAQTKLNIAVLANPYVAAAAAVAALAAGLVILYKNMGTTEEKQNDLTAAMEAYDDALESNMKQSAEQINTFNQLKRIYDESGGKVDILTNKIINNDDAQRKLGVSLKTVDDVHQLFGRNSQNYINASIARAKALAAEQASALLLGNTMAELTKIFNKLMRGEEVNYVDLENIMKKSGLSEQTINKLIAQAGGQSKFELFGKNDLYVPEYAVEGFVSELMKSVTDAYYKEGGGKWLGDLISSSLNEASTAEINFNNLLTNNLKGIKSVGKTNTSSSGGGTNGKTAIDYEKGSLEELNAQMKVYQDRLKNENLTLEEKITILRQIVGLTQKINALNESQSRIRTGLENIVNGNLEKALTPSAVETLSLGIKLKPYVDPSALKQAGENLMKGINDQTAERLAEHAKQVRNNWMNAADALGSFGDAMSTLGSLAKDEGTQVAGIIAQAIASIALGYAQATAQAGKLGPWGWVAFAASGLAQMMAMIAQIKSVTGGYAEGGIIGGTSYSGDKLIARVNSGEMVLNKRQQSNLFNAINSGNIGGGTVSTVSFKLRGADIYGSVKNYTAIKGKTGLKGL